jgi:hypothetical protein
LISEAGSAGPADALVPTQSVDADEGTAMRKPGFTVTRVIFGVLAASVLAAAMLVASEAGSANAATCTGKCFAVTVSPAIAAQGANASFAFAITNEASTQQLGSVQISAPAGFTITDAPGAANSFPSSSALFLNLSLAPSHKTILTLNADVPDSGGLYQWGIQAKQSNNFNGTGNDFLLDPASAGNLSGFVGSVQSCSGSCSASSSTNTTSATVTTTSATDGDSLGFSLGSVSFTCNANYQQVSDAVFFDVFNSSGVPVPTAQFNVSLEIFKSAVLSSGRTGASQWQICYASQQSFTAQDGTSSTATIGGVSYFTGLLPNCSSTQGAPCVQDRHKDNAGDVVIDFIATGDPIGWG